MLQAVERTRLLSYFVLLSGHGDPRGRVGCFTRDWGHRRFSRLTGRLRYFPPAIWADITAAVRRQFGTEYRECLVWISCTD